MSTLDDEVLALAGAMAPGGCQAGPDDTFSGDLSYSSLRFLELTIALEAAFELEPLTPEDLAGVVRVSDLIAVVRTKRSRS